MFFSGILAEVSPQSLSGGRFVKRWSVIQGDEEFWSDLSKARRCVLILDYDGTLAPFVPDPAKAVPYDGVREVVERLMENPHCRVVFVTGRSCDDLVRLLGLPHQPEVWGSHGGERLLPSGERQLFDIAPGAETALKRAETMAREAGYVDNLEVKPGCVAFHLRSLDEDVQDEAFAWVSNHWQSLADGGGLTFATFDGGTEVRSPGFTKDTAVLSILEETGHDDVVFYLGDDATDEDAFAAITGQGIGILVQTEDRPSLAIWVLRPPEEVLAFLSAVDNTL
jgi:trehalose-phosphatase